ncbi:hypothetical protein Mmc1_3046 [Magnetococcus marinus MC-1]|uniref:Ysc84 actin-binding domain-containing protein n=1 Tax=Magnetococcus marinus (strain ATCC BAA-1437 / JCM 17883 / MC-1) TaxID=156889 RepID=A0LC44_MAGMM|nr:hypothetical protein [Magnetococcus marinus]ABK45537.1 hypothetical protein Mmc1_3046 [Magnetococcus marinus MC-1]
MKRYLRVVVAVPMIFGAFQVGSAKAASYQPAVSYNEYSETKLEKCYQEKFFGEKIKKCIKAGTIGGGVNGQASLLTFANEDTGEIGAVLLAEQNFVVNLFGTKIEVGAICQYNNSKKAETGVFLGYSLSTPAIPSVSIKDIVVAVITRAAAAKVGSMANKAATAKVSNGKASSGYAGAVASASFNQLMSAGVSGCTLNTPDMKLFSGIKGVDLFKAGIQFTMVADKININTSTGSASVVLTATSEAIAKVGGEKVSFSVAGQKVKWSLPGFEVKEGVTLMKKTIQH